MWLRVMPDSSTSDISPLRPMQIISFRPCFTSWTSSPKTILPSAAAVLTFCSTMRLAVPPMWKVRSVSCVPGSPIDCAAITPTGSPMSTSLSSARL